MATQRELGDLPMPNTRDRCAEPGKYVSTCYCRTPQGMTVGMYFPSCVACGKSVEWELETGPPARAVGDDTDARMAATRRIVNRTRRQLSGNFERMTRRRMF